MTVSEYGYSTMFMATYQYDSDNYPTRMTGYEVGESEDMVSVYFEYQ